MRHKRFKPWRPQSKSLVRVTSSSLTTRSTKQKKFLFRRWVSSNSNTQWISTWWAYSWSRARYQSQPIPKPNVNILTYRLTLTVHETTQVLRWHFDARTKVKHARECWYGNLRWKVAEKLTLNIAIIGSTAGKFGEANHIDYSASKSALMYGFNYSLKNEIIRILPRATVNVIAPGYVHYKRIDA